MFIISIRHLLTSIGVAMDQDKPYWAKIVSKILKTELAKRDMGYSKLVERLDSLDVHIRVEDLRARVSRGNFSAMLFVQCLRAMGVKNLQLEDSFFETKEDK
jgi:Domain of unknown function (DUF6471)